MEVLKNNVNSFYFADNSKKTSLELSWKGFFSPEAAKCLIRNLIYDILSFFYFKASKIFKTPFYLKIAHSIWNVVFWAF